MTYRTKGDTGAGGFPPIMWDWRSWRDVIYSASGIAPADEVVLALFNAPTGDGIDRALVTGLAWDESSFNPRATGAAGEVGLMQLSTVALQDVERLRDKVGATGFVARPELRTDPKYSVRAATYYLRLLRTHYFEVYGLSQLERVTGDVELLVLAWYKAGPGNLNSQALEFAMRAKAKVAAIRREAEAYQQEVEALAGR